MKTQDDNVTECWTCGGDGALTFLSTRQKRTDIPCQRCHGTGWVPEEMLAWEKAGARLRSARQARRVGIREEAFARGIRPTVLFDAEAGIIDPAPYLAGEEPPMGENTAIAPDMWRTPGEEAL